MSHTSHTAAIEAALEAQGYKEFGQILDMMPANLAQALAVVLARKDVKINANWRQLEDARDAVAHLKNRRLRHQARIAELQAALRTEQAKTHAPHRDVADGHERTAYQSKAIGAWICVDYYTDDDSAGRYTDLAHVWAGDVDILPMISAEQANKVLLEVIQAARNPEV